MNNFFPYLILVLCFGSRLVFGAMNDSRVRIAGQGGLGQALITSSSNLHTMESPLGFALAVDYLMSSQLSFGAEHIRSFGQSGSAVGLTGLSVKWYFWLPHPLPLLEKNEAKVPLLQIEGWIPYVGGMLGVGQASVLDSTINTLGLALGLKGGLEYPIFGNWGLRTEGNLSVTSGTGSIVLVNALAGFYLFL